MRHSPNSRHLVRLDVLGVILAGLYSYEHPAVGSRFPYFIVCCWPNEDRLFFELGNRLRSIHG